MVSIELRGVGVAHDGTDVLSGVDLHVASGEVVALLGRSGSGKTSLLRVVAGHDRVSAGRVLLDGQDVTGLRANQRRLGMVAQGAPLQPTEDVEGNLVLPFVLRGEDRDEGRLAARGEALRFGLDRLLRRRTNTLSEGQRARTAVARSVVSGPPVMLLDEPAAALDHHGRERLLRQVLAARDQRGATLLVSTNNLAVAAQMADRIAVIDRGTLAQVGPLHALRDAPGSLAVADLVHELPLVRLDAAVDPGDRGRRTRVVTAAGAVATWDTRVRDHDGPVVLATDARGLDVVAAGAGDLRGEVRRVVTTGPRNHVTVGTDAGPVVVDASSDAEVPPVGAAVGVLVRRAFVADTGGTVIAVVDAPTG